MESTDIIEILDIQHGTRVDMSVEELETYAKAHINDPDWAFTPFRNKIHIDYLVDASEVYKLDDISLKAAIYILRMINVYEARGEVDEFIESGLNISIEKLAKKGYLKVMESVIKELEGEEARKKFQKKREKLEKAPIPVRLDFDIYTVFKDLTDYIFALYDNANLFYDEPELKIKEKVFEVIPTEANPDKIKKLDDLTHKDAIRLLRVFNSFRRKDIVDKFLIEIGDFEDIYMMFHLFVGYLFHEYDTADFFLNEPELDPRYPGWQKITFGRSVRLDWE